MDFERVLLYVSFYGYPSFQVDQRSVSPCIWRFCSESLAELLTTTIRGYDLLARYGGEKFVFLVREEREVQLVSLLTESAMKFATECSNMPGFEHRLRSALAITGGMDLIEIQGQRIYCGWPMIISMWRKAGARSDCS